MYTLKMSVQNAEVSLRSGSVLEKMYGPELAQSPLIMKCPYEEVSIKLVRASCLHSFLLTEQEVLWVVYHLQGGNRLVHGKTSRRGNSVRDLQFTLIYRESGLSLTKSKWNKIFTTQVVPLVFEIFRSDKPK